MSIDYQIPFIFDSGATSAKEKSVDGSQFTVHLETPLIIPHNAVYCYVTVQDASVWNTVYNVVAGVNDVFYIEYDPGNDGMIVYNVTITLLAGLYDVPHLNSALLRELHNQPNLPSDLFYIVPDTASGRAVIQFNYHGTQIDFTQLDTLRALLGFDARLVPAGGLTPSVTYEIGDQVAHFNVLEYFTIGTDLIQKGIRVNDRYNQTLVKIPVLEEPGSQIAYHPQTPAHIPANELISAKKKTITFWLTDNLLQRVNTNGESFSISLTIHYVIKNNETILDY
jgi:hypothetical protein